MALGGLHDCASLFLVLFTVNFMMNPKSALHCALQGEWVLAFGPMNYGIVSVTVNRF